MLFLSIRVFFCELLQFTNKTIVNDTIDENKGDFIMTILEKLRQEGMQLGRSLFLAVFGKFEQNSITKKMLP